MHNPKVLYHSAIAFGTAAVHNIYDDLAELCICTHHQQLRVCFCMLPLPQGCTDAFEQLVKHSV